LVRRIWLAVICSNPNAGLELDLVGATDGVWDRTSK